jgi:hypothetical protein
MPTQIGSDKVSFANNSASGKLFCAQVNEAYAGILNLPIKARFGVYVAYKYYLSLFKKIQRLEPAHILESRIRIPDYGKAFILAKAGIRSQLNIM